MKLKQDERLNSELQKEVSELRDGMFSQIKKEESSRFVANPSNENPSTIITDTITGKTVEVPLFASREVLMALNVLFM